MDMVVVSGADVAWAAFTVALAFAELACACVRERASGVGGAA